jgi:hypothetical protein
MAALAAAMAFALQPAAAGHAGLDDSQNPSCPIARGVPSTLNQVIAFSGSLSCYRPGGQSGAFFGKDVAPGNTQIRSSNPSQGDPCRDINHYKVAFVDDTTGNGAAARFAFAGGATSGVFGLGSRYFNEADAAMMGTNDGYVTDVQLGTYELSNAADPNSPLECRLNPTFHFFCPATDTLDQFCFTWVGDNITPAASPPQAWGPFFNVAFGRLSGEAGTIHSAPARTAVVNTRTCFWVEGMGIPAERDLVLTLAGAPDATGRQIFYTFLARIQFLRLAWQFDDPAGNVELPVPTECQGHQMATSHIYPQISDGRNGDNTYHVSVTEQYSITVQAFWNDAFGTHGPIDVDPGVPAPSISPTMLAQPVGQIEGIPIGNP